MEFTELNIFDIRIVIGLNDNVDGDNYA